MVDTCIFNNLLDGRIDLTSLPSDAEYVATHIQIDEIKATPSKERREMLLKKFDEVVERVIPTESAIIDVSKIGQSKISDDGGGVYETLKDGLDKKN